MQIADNRHGLLNSYILPALRALGVDLFVLHLALVPVAVAFDAVFIFILRASNRTDSDQ